MSIESDVIWPSGQNPKRDQERPASPSTPLRADRHEGQDANLIPVRILNEFVYCPRLAYLEWVQKEWQDSADTVEGTHTHRRADAATGKLPPATELANDQRARISALTLSSERLGIVAKLDVLEVDAGIATPVEYKRGKRPHVARNAYDPERVQLCAQGLLLEEAGYSSPRGMLYFAGSRERVPVEFDDALRQLTLNTIEEIRKVVDREMIPPALEDSPKCPRCSLVSICLPDETGFLQQRTQEVRPLAVGRTRRVPVYVQAHRARVGKKGDCLEIAVDDEVTSRPRLAEISKLVVMGNVYVTTPALHELMRREIPIAWHSYGVWFLGHTIGTGHGNVELRTRQFEASFDAEHCLQIARGLTQAKIRNCRTLLRRNSRTPEVTETALVDMRRLAEQAGRARSLDSLLGIEGAAAASYFGNFTHMLVRSEDPDWPFEFGKRNRRPPTDPVNALLSFGYAMLTRTLTTTINGTGLDPYRGFYHQPRFGRPALALDLMEPFRPLLVDSFAVRAINNGELDQGDFVHTPVGVNLNPAGRKKAIAAFERRLDQEVTHPQFGYSADYRRIIELQVRLLGRHLLGELDENPNFTTR